MTDSTVSTRLTISHQGLDFPYRADSVADWDNPYTPKPLWVTNGSFYRDATNNRENVSYAIMHEAYEENLARTASARATEAFGDRHAQAQALAAMRRREQVAQDALRATKRDCEIAREQVRALQNDQISGDDDRLADFWQQAQGAADRAGHCEVFDELASELGGPRRERDLSVTLTLTFDVNVSVTTSGSGSEYFEDMSESDVLYYVQDQLTARNLSSWDAKESY